MESMWQNLLENGLVTNKYDINSKMFAIKICENDVNYLNENYSLIINSDIMKDLFLIACMFSNTIHTIIFLIEKFKVKVKYTNKKGDNCLTLGSCNSNIQIVKYLIEDLNVDVEHYNNKGNNCLIMACMKNTNIEVIKYLIQEVKININICNNALNDCLMMACYDNTCLEIIQYLIEDVKMNQNRLNIKGYNCLMASCRTTRTLKYINLEIVKYLIEECKMDVNTISQCGNNCFTLSCMENINDKIQIIIYLIEKTNVPLLFEKIKPEKIDLILPLIKNNYLRFNEIIEIAMTVIDNEKIINILKNVNPMMINSQLAQKLNINQYSGTYQNFVNNIESLTNIDPIPLDYNFTKNNTENKNIELDFTKQSEILFRIKQDNTYFYGSREIVYPCMHWENKMNEVEPLLDIGEIYDPDLINLYIQSCYDNMIDMEDLSPDNFEQFINLIVKYPTNVLSFNLLEKELIMFIMKHKQTLIIPKNINEICTKYELKYMYQYFSSKFKVVKIEKLKS